jgi:hypothetical protein
MQNRTGRGARGGAGTLQVNLVDRRRFLARVAAIGGAAAASSGWNFIRAAETPQTPGPVAGRVTPSADGRGKVLDVRGEVKEYKDPKTGARVRQLTGDGSSNVQQSRGRRSGPPPSGRQGRRPFTSGAVHGWVQLSPKDQGTSVSRLGVIGRALGSAVLQSLTRTVGAPSSASSLSRMSVASGRRTVCHLAL